MLENLSEVIQHARDHQTEYISLIEQFAQIPSVSHCSEDINHAAEWLGTQLRAIGCREVEVIPTTGAPVVLASTGNLNAQGYSILAYGHYDVQPAENLNDWRSPPFSPQVRGNKLYGRGVSDMKGQIVALLAALQAVQSQSNLPFNIKLIIEGEEEIGSPNLESFLHKHQDLLKSDFVLNLDVGFLSADLPTISYGLRGIASFELTVRGPEQDLHSGVFGGVIHNPALVISNVLSGIFDDYGKITLPGFYEKVLDLGENERQVLSQLPMDEMYYLTKSNAPQLWGEGGYSPLERIAARPTFEINGLRSGYIGDGEKTIIPSDASAKITTRLVPDQNPEAVHKQLLEYLEEKMPPTVAWELHFGGGIAAYLTDLTSPVISTFAESLEQAYGKKAVYFRDGGSIPAAVLMKEILGLDSLLSGFGLPTDNIHGPDEHIHLPTLFKGIEALIYFFNNLSIE